MQNFEYSATISRLCHRLTKLVHFSQRCLQNHLHTSMPCVCLCVYVSLNRIFQFLHTIHRHMYPYRHTSAHALELISFPTIFISIFVALVIPNNIIHPLQHSIELNTFKLRKERKKRRKKTIIISVNQAHFYARIHWHDLVIREKKNSIQP